MDCSLTPHFSDLNEWIWRAEHSTLSLLSLYYQWKVTHPLCLQPMARICWLMYKSSNLIRSGFECYMCPLQRVNSNECQQSLISHVNVKQAIQNRTLKLDLLLTITKIYRPKVKIYVFELHIKFPFMWITVNTNLTWCIFVSHVCNSTNKLNVF